MHIACWFPAANHLRDLKWLYTRMAENYKHKKWKYPINYTVPYMPVELKTNGLAENMHGTLLCLSRCQFIAYIVDCNSYALYILAAFFSCKFQFGS